MKTVLRKATLVFLAALTAPPAMAMTANQEAQQCRVDAGLAGNVDKPTGRQAVAMYLCVKRKIDAVGADHARLMMTFRDWRKEHEGLLIAGGGRLAARTCQEEKNNRRYIEDRIGDVRDAGQRHPVTAGEFEALYRAFVFELNVVFLGTAEGAAILPDIIRDVSDQLQKWGVRTERERKAIERFYVDLQQTRFEEACGTPTVRNPPPGSLQCKWQTRTAFNASRGRHRTTATGYVCVCPPGDGRSVWPAAEPQRCGPYPSETAGGGQPATPASPSRAAPPAAGSGGGWTVIQ